MRRQNRRHENAKSAAPEDREFFGNLVTKAFSEISSQVESHLRRSGVTNSLDRDSIVNSAMHRVYCKIIEKSRGPSCGEIPRLVMWGAVRDEKCGFMRNESRQPRFESDLTTLVGREETDPENTLSELIREASSILTQQEINAIQSYLDHAGRRNSKPRFGTHLKGAIAKIKSIVT